MITFNEWLFSKKKQNKEIQVGDKGAYLFPNERPNMGVVDSVLNNFIDLKDSVNKIIHINLSDVDTKWDDSKNMWVFTAKPDAFTGKFKFPLNSSAPKDNIQDVNPWDGKQYHANHDIFKPYRR